MPLRDHFHPPLSALRHWESLHALWAGSLAEALNGSLLPSGYFAEVQVQIGGRVEVDVGTFREPTSGNGGSAAGGTATLSAPAYAPPQTALSLAAVFPDETEVLVFSEDGGVNLVAAVELVSPSNKDRPEARRAFAMKCAAYLQSGVGLVIVDVVTKRLANLHDELTTLLGQPEAGGFAADVSLYAAAYRPVRRAKTDLIDVWPFPLAVGQPLPIVPLPVRGLGLLPLDLEALYADACRRCRLPPV